jgi:hypothetical protein
LLLGSFGFFTFLNLEETLKKQNRRERGDKQQSNNTKTQKQTNQTSPSSSSFPSAAPSSSSSSSSSNRNHSMPRIRMGYSVIHFTVTHALNLEHTTYHHQPSSIIEAVN